MPRCRKYTDEEFLSAVASSTSVAQVLRKLRLRPVGGNYGTVRRLAKKLDADMDHFVGQAHNRGKYMPLGTLVNKRAIRKYMLRKFGHQCQECARSAWRGYPIPLELEHVDGDNTNNEEANLTMLCCNCHALTSTWRGRNTLP